MPPPLPPPSVRKFLSLGSPLSYATPYAVMKLEKFDRIGAAPALGATVAGVCTAISFETFEQRAAPRAAAAIGESKIVEVRRRRCGRNAVSFRWRNPGGAYVSAVRVSMTVGARPAVNPATASIWYGQ